MGIVVAPAVFTVVVLSPCLQARRFFSCKRRTRLWTPVTLAAIPPRLVKTADTDESEGGDKKFNFEFGVGNVDGTLFSSIGFFCACCAAPANLSCVALYLTTYFGSSVTQSSHLLCQGGAVGRVGLFTIGMPIFCCNFGVFIGDRESNCSQ